MEAAAYLQFRELEEHHWWFRGRRAVYLGLLRHELAGHTPTRALDLGCGVGGFLDGLAQLGAQVYPTDLDRNSLLRCALRGFGRGVVANGYALPYRDGAFDLVCLFDALEHIPDDARALREVARVLAPGGRVVISVPAYPFLFANNDRVACHYRRYTRSTLRRVLTGAGFALERNTHTNVFLFPLILPAVLLLKAKERLLRQSPDRQRTNLSVPLPRALHRLLAGVFTAELPFSRRFDWPAGHSILALARKPQ
ncbi:MAG: class I SAM-dependent methyltransferase [Planctomycetes bacterium]|nr:class I SAM-dependent methyltransferase [Planctomycetota bacterium]